MIGELDAVRLLSVTPDLIRGLPSFYRRKEEGESRLKAGMTRESR
jgi:hypothetical protein